jgi:hypothetical protein
MMFSNSGFDFRDPPAAHQAPNFIVNHDKRGPTISWAVMRPIFDSPVNAFYHCVLQDSSGPSGLFSAKML